MWQSRCNRRARLYHGNVEDMLRKLPRQSVHCVVTSPPYWGQREHAGLDKELELGNEDTPEQYVHRLVDICESLKPVLRDDGTFWLNLGDTYEDGELVGVPWLCAFALKRAGWRLRNDNVWHKTDAMPTETRTRHSRAHEYVFQFSKPNRAYYFDSYADLTKTFRTVWPFSHGKGYGGGHFSVFPPELPTICIAAGTSERGCCPNCGAQWRRVVEKERVPTRPGNRTKVTGNGAHEGNRDPQRHVTRVTTTGWEPGCECVDFEEWSTTQRETPEDPVPSIVLDPFAGSGTTIATALGLGRCGWGIELSMQYIRENAIPRIEGEMLQRPALRGLIPARGRA